MTAIPLGAPLPTHSSHLPADVTRAASMSAYLVLLRMEVAAFHPRPGRCYPVGPRLVSVALFIAFIAALTATYSVWALPSIPLCGARTFLSPFRLHVRSSDGLADFEEVG